MSELDFEQLFSRLDATHIRIEEQNRRIDNMKKRVSTSYKDYRKEYGEPKPHSDSAIDLSWEGSSK